MKTVTVRVTAEDIANGKRGSCWKCPLALAISRRLKRELAVDNNVVRDIMGKRIAKTPAAAKRFMTVYDYGHRVKPFTFKLRLKD